jgi:hypothetical protein
MPFEIRTSTYHRNPFSWSVYEKRTLRTGLDDVLGWLISISGLYDEVLRELLGVAESESSATKLILLRRIINTGVIRSSPRVQD